MNQTIDSRLGTIDVEVDSLVDSFILLGTSKVQRLPSGPGGLAKSSLGSVQSLPSMLKINREKPTNKSKAR